MAVTGNIRYTGINVQIAFDAGVGHFQSIEIVVKRSKWNAPSSDSDVEQRGSGRADAEITLKGWDVGKSSGSGGLSFDALAALVLSKAAPSAFSWTDTTPTTRLPADFFTWFPLAGMRLDEVNGGSGDAEKASEWTAKVSVNNVDIPAS